MKKRKTKKGSTAQEQTIAFRPGWLIINSSKAHGGVKYERESIGEHPINRGDGISTEYTTQKTVDHVEFCARIDACVKRVDYVLLKSCIRTELGWFTDQVGLKKIRAEIVDLQREADVLNTQVAAAARSSRRAKIYIAPFRFDPVNHEAVQEIASTIRSVLSDYRDVLRNGDVASLHKLKMRAFNLARMAQGVQADAIRFALERVPLAAAELRAGIKSGKTPEMAGAVLDLEVFDAALANFEDSIFEMAA
jgi:hypothetical protein